MKLNNSLAMIQLTVSLVLIWLVALSPIEVSAQQVKPSSMAKEPNNSAQITLYRSASCGCCTRWGDHARQAGFQVQEKVIDEMDNLKRSHGITRELSSCHSAFVAGYIVEGHVPEASIRRMLKEKPNIQGLTAPGMPMGSPGMETEGIKPESFDVLAIANDGSTSLFDHYASE